MLHQLYHQAMVKHVISDTDIRFKWSFLAPKYMLTWLAIIFIGISASLPRRISVKIGDYLGLTYGRLNKKRTRIVDINLKMCFPNLPAGEREKLAHDHFRYYGRSLIDFGLTWFASRDRLSRLIRFHNAHHLLDTISKHNVIVLLPHMTGLDCGAGFAPSLHPSITMMKLQKNDLVNWRLWKGRTRVGNTRIILRSQGLRPLIRATKNRIACFYMPDEDFGDNDLTVFSSFFGVQTSTLTTLSAMARLANAKVVPIYPIMREDGRYDIYFDSPLESFPSNDKQADAALVNQVIEKCVRLAPAQYMWTLRWFKTRPDKKPSPYA